MALDLQTKIDITETDPDFVTNFRGGPEPADEYLALRVGDDYRSYTKMKRDPHIRSQLTKRVLAVLGRRVLLEGKNKKLIEQYKQILELVTYEDLCKQLLDSGMLIGFAVLRLDWEEIEGLTLPKYEFVPQNRFIFAYRQPDDLTIPVADGSTDLDPNTEIVLVRGYELRLLTKAHPIKGERCPKGRFLVFTFDSQGSPWGLGLGYSIFPWFTVKSQAMKAWLLHSDRTGSPPVKGTVPGNLNPDKPKEAALLNKFYNWLRSVSPNGWFAGTEGFVAELLSDPSMTPDVHERLIDKADAQVSKGILGEVAYSDKATGSYAANQSQVDDREASLTDADCNLLDEQLSKEFWAEVERLNFPNVKDLPKVRRETIADQREVAKKSEQEAAKKDRVDRDKTLNDMGYRVKPEAVAVAYGDEYIDTSISNDSEDKTPSLISTLQVGGTQALIGFLSGFSQSGLSKENAIAVLTTVFGVSADLAAEMLPEPPAPEEAAPTDLQGALDSALGGTEETPATADTTDLAEPLVTVEAVLDRVLSAEFSGAIDFATKAKGPKKCKPTSVSCGNSCQRVGSKCKNKSNPEGQKAGDLLEKSIGKGSSNSGSNKKAEKTSDGTPTKAEVTKAADDYLKSVSYESAKDQGFGGPYQRLVDANNEVKKGAFSKKSADEQASLLNAQTNVGGAAAKSDKGIAGVSAMQQQHLYNSLSDEQKNVLAKHIKENPYAGDWINTEAKNPRIRAISEDAQGRIDKLVADEKEAKRKRKQAASQDSSDLDALLGDVPDKPKASAKSASQSRSSRRTDSSLPTEKQFAGAELVSFRPSTKSSVNENALSRTTIDGKDYFVKKTSAKDASKESATSDVADLLGVNDVIRSTSFKRDGENYIVSPLVKGKSLQEIGSPNTLKGLSENKLAELALFDFVIGNSDRHEGNVFLTEDKKIRLIDHDSAFANTSQIPRYNAFLQTLNGTSDGNISDSTRAKKLPSNSVKKILANEDKIRESIKKAGLNTDFFDQRMDALKSAKTPTIGTLVDGFSKPKTTASKPSVSKNEDFDDLNDLFNF